MANPEEKKNKCKAADLKPGDYLSRISYCKVISKKGGKLRIQNEDGFEWSISANIVENEMFSATQFEQIKKVTRTEMVDLLMHDVGDACFEAVFHKQPKDSEIVESLNACDYKALTEQTKKRKAIKQSIVGQTRTLVGRILKREPTMGRTLAIDLNIQGAHRQRQVDHRTLERLTFRGTRYELK